MVSILKRDLSEIGAYLKNSFKKGAFLNFLPINMSFKYISINLFFVEISVFNTDRRVKEAVEKAYQMGKSYANITHRTEQEMRDFNTHVKNRLLKLEKHANGIETLP